ncbi:MAG TPA: hypothetical protein VI999_08200 [Thermoplasmata archaeon]|nr:hypothetical protein [Thermoplasmata archaeon]
MSYDIGNLGLKSGGKKKTWLYVGIVAVVIVVAVVATKLAAMW